MFVPRIVTPGDSWATIASCISERKMLGDLQVAKDGTAAGNMGMLRKQIDSVGLGVLSGSSSSTLCGMDETPHLPIESDSLEHAATLAEDVSGDSYEVDVSLADALPLDAANAPGAEDDRNVPHDGRSLRRLCTLLLATTDEGSDASKSRRASAEAAMTRDNTVGVEGACWQRQYQLMVKSLMLQMDRVLWLLGASLFYWSSVAKILHCVRNNASDFFFMWKTCTARKARWRMPCRSPRGNALYQQLKTRFSVHHSVLF